MSLAVITGVASGMGRATAVAFAHAGWTVVGVDRDQAGLDAIGSELGPALRAVSADICDGPAVSAAIDAAVGGERLAAVVNVAGIYPPTTIDTATEELYRRIFDVNVLGTVNVIRACLPKLVEGGGGGIVNFSSVDAFEVSPGQLLYSASKAAVVALTKSLALELAPHRITVNCVAPGWVDTPGNAATGRMADVAHTIPLGRVAAPAEIADWVLRLADPGYMTGETIVLSGGSVLR